MSRVFIIVTSFLFVIAVFFVAWGSYEIVEIDEVCKRKCAQEYPGSRAELGAKACYCIKPLPPDAWRKNQGKAIHY